MIPVPGLKKYIFSVDTGLADDVEPFFSGNKQSYLGTPKFIIPLASDPTTGLKTFTFDIGERAADDVMALESADIWHRRLGHLHPAAMETTWKFLTIRLHWYILKIRRLCVQQEPDA